MLYYIMDIELECPHCKNYFIVNEKEINCGIFRHAVYKKNIKPINPHETKENCEKLIKEELIYGCAKPFKISKQENKYVIEICDYI
jgi:hypothetical protein